MTEDAARHALSMDQVLLSVKKTFSDPSAVDGQQDTIPQSLASEKFLPATVRAQQQRLISAQTRRTKLPPLPAILRDRNQQQTSSAPASPQLHSDVPSAVEINAIHHPEPTVATATSSTEPEGSNGEALPHTVDLDALGVPDRDWDWLKTELRSVVDEWVDRQKNGRPSSQ